MNDGSQDDSMMICNYYATIDYRIKIINNSNHGVSYSRNCGIKNAKGMFVMFLDSDDFIELNAIDLMVEKVVTDIDLVVAGITTELYDECNYIRNIEIETSKAYIEYDIQNTNPDWEYIFSNNNIASPCNKIYRLEIIKSNNILFNEKCFSYEDLLFNLNYMIYARKIVFIEEIVYHYCNLININQKRKRIKPELFKNANEFAKGAFDFIDHYKLDNNSIIYAYIGLQYRRAMELLSNMNISYRERITCLQKLEDEEVFHKFLDTVSKDNRYFIVIKYLINRKMFISIYMLNYFYVRLYN